jgi:uncharacterized protein with NAD-binding domain and iron-sulfur cluster
VPKVAILGGGVGGLSAAHELVERGFDVEIYERRDVPGGKARSFYHSPPHKDWKLGLPAEHGFRFFPGFYRHVTDTMSRIASFAPGKTVFDNLVPTTELALVRYDEEPLVLPTRWPSSIDELVRALERLLHADRPKFEPGEIAYYAERIWQILTSCHERRDDEYERTGWWDFIGADQRSRAYRKYLGNLSRTLVAADPRLVSTRTNGNAFVQMLLDFGRSGVQVDRVLNGPTNEVWIHPWVDQLVRRGCRYYLNTKVTALECSGGRITGATITPLADPPMFGGPAEAVRVLECGRYGVTRTEPLGKKGAFTVEADYYVSALPVEAMAALVGDDLVAADPSLGRLATLAQSTAWMNGLLFYLADDVPIVHGHTIYIDPSWALTSISQRQFWERHDQSGETDNPLARYADGRIGGILSIDISNWRDLDRDSADGERAAYQCAPEQIVDFTWQYVQKCLPQLEGTTPLYHKLDPAIGGLLDWLRQHDESPKGAAGAGPGGTPEDLYSEKVRNLEPLLVNQVNTLSLRPDAHTRISNLFLASDYVRTNTDLATMEAANEAARRAVNALLDAAGSRAPKCRLWKLREPWVLALYRWRDKRRYDKGLPWRNPSPWLWRLGRPLERALRQLLPKR